MTGFTFALNERDQTPEWTSDLYLVQVVDDGGVAAFANPNEEFDDYEEIDLDTVTDPALLEMIAAARKYIAEGGKY
ncbi:hypothetical protein ACT17_22885 [Mycolicibacterium conceptionense]|uniref:Uncharacterized protein n=1 Tax=Mycolicibacterium conceptionense TaxID=451644 RepID=A0A0J8U4D0_9MYCO|nr:hypothetical protein [Mycolicibacterium conceptionense]KMV15942.1 hypothetical protein ACT17_22885 [Mycolicibacterium conceptionense]